MVDDKMRSLGVEVSRTHIVSRQGPTQEANMCCSKCCLSIPIQRYYCLGVLQYAEFSVVAYKYISGHAHKC